MKYLISTPCLKEAFDYYRVEFKIELDYENSIQEIQTGKYYAVGLLVDMVQVNFLMALIQI